MKQTNGEDSLKTQRGKRKERQGVVAILGPVMFSRTARLGLLLTLLSAPASAASSELLVSPSGSVTVGGRSVTLRTPPQFSGDTLLLPVRETAGLLGRPVQVSGTLIQAGRLVIQTSNRSMTIDGVPYAGPLVIPSSGDPLVDAKLLAYALDGQLVTRPGGGVTILGVPAGAPPSPSLPLPPVAPAPVPATSSVPQPATAAVAGAPEARFATNKTVYAPGERVTYTDFSFDPDGLNLARKWEGMSDVFFTPGEHRISLVVTNTKGRTSVPYTRVIRVEGAPLATPLSYALQTSPIGSTFQDTRNPAYPALTPVPRPDASYPLLFSDSPEAPTQSGVLYQDRASGRVRVVAYHLNRLGRPARLLVVAQSRSAAGSVQVIREGSAGGTRMESVLGQVSVLDFLTSAGRAAQQLPAQGLTALYTSPVLAPEQGAKVMLDLQITGEAQISVVMLEDGRPLTDATLAALPKLEMDPQHQRGTFPGAVRSLTVRLGSTPGRLTLGDNQSDPPLLGVDAMTGAPQRLSGNYGVQYDITVENTSPGTSTVASFAPRGGQYRGGLVVEDGAERQVLRIPGSGVLTNGDAPLMLWRTPSRVFRMSFIPSGGSFLPVSLVFYPVPGEVGP